jgi:hypothetical protein
MRWLKYLLFIAFVGAVIGGGVFCSGRAGKSVGVNVVERSGASNPTNQTEEGLGTSRVVTASEPSSVIYIPPQVRPVNAAATGLNSETSEKVEPMENMTFFVSTARSVLKKLNVPIEGRRPTTKVEDGEVIVTFPPRQGEFSGSFIVRINRETGEIIDTKIWR